MFSYTTEVIASVWAKSQDGTLNASELYARSGHRLQAYLAPAEGGYIQVKSGDIRTRSIEDYRVIINDEEQYARLDRDKFVPCFHPAPQFHPFERVHAHDDLFADDNEPGENDDTVRFPESFLSPAYMHRLQLAEIEHRFPGGEAGDIGDKDVRNLLSAQSYVFYFNYQLLNEKRLGTVGRGMARTLLVSTTALTLLGGIACWSAGLVTTAQNLAGHGAGPILHAATSAPALIGAMTGLTVLAAYGAARTARWWAEHCLDIHRGQFESFTSTSCARVSKAVTSRQDNLIYLERSMMEEIDRSREGAWAQKSLPEWVIATKRWVRSVFWIHERMGATEEHMSINMKIIGLHYSGQRTLSRFHGLKLAGGYNLTGGVLMVIFAIVMWWLFTHGVTGYGLVMPGIAGMLIVGYYWLQIEKLHERLKAQEAMKSIQVVINLASTAYTKGYRDSALHDVISEYLEREKQKMLMEEEKLRGK